MEKAIIYRLKYNALIKPSIEIVDKIFTRKAGGFHEPVVPVVITDVCIRID